MVAVSSDPIKKYFRRTATGSFHPPAPERSEDMFTEVVELTSKSGKSKVAAGTSVLLDIHQSWFRENR
jgi:hypothetical protein